MRKNIYLKGGNTNISASVLYIFSSKPEKEIF